MKLNALQTRVKHRLADLGLSPIEAAMKADLERNYIHDLVSARKSSISQEKLPKVAKALEWTVEQLLGHDGVNQVPSDNSGVPEMEVRGGAAYGGGITQEESTVDEYGNLVSTDAIRARWGIPLPFLREELQVRPGRANILPIRGDSMNDALYDGDRVLIDLDDTDIAQGGIFALIDDNGSVIIKQVELVRAGSDRKLLCTSRNPRYQPFELALGETVKIIGRVACKITRL